MITFIGGGFGHGIGMSQYGAYGRADAGHTYDEILAWYYDGTELGLAPSQSDEITDFSTADDVDVRVDVRGSIAISTPLDQVDEAFGWEIELEAGGEAVGTATKPISADWNGSRWTAISDSVDLCEGIDACAGNALEFILSGEERVVLEEAVNGPNLGEYRSGRIILHPADLPGPKGGFTTTCGSQESDEFCVIHGDLDLQDYLYGLAEIPDGWPIEAQKAQAVAGRSYAVSRIVQRNVSPTWQAPFDLYESTQDQFYTGWDKWEHCLDESGSLWCDGVDATDDEIVVYEGGVAETFYSASNGGATASPPDVWSAGTALPYLQAKADPYDSNDANPYAVREYTYTVAQVSDWLNAYIAPSPVPFDQLHVGNVQYITIDTNASGRVSFAEVTIVGDQKSVVVEGQVVNGQVVDRLYGFRFYAALVNGCEAEQDAGADIDCLRSTNFSVISFTDISPENFYYNPVLWMAKEEITTGTGPGEFSPLDPVTRAQAAAFMWRFSGEPEPEELSGFDDIPDDTWFTDAVAWLKEQKITTGTSSTEFSPNDVVTRAQLATFLYRLAGEPEAPANDQFEDVLPDRFYTDPVAWMVHHEITTGTSPTTFHPDRELNRGELATFMWRLAGKPEAFAEGIDLPTGMRS